MTGWCLLLVCLGAALVQAEENNTLDQYVREKAVAFHRVADRDGDGILVFQDYILISRNVLIIPGYTKFNESYIFDNITVDSWTAFPNRNLTLAEFLDELAGIDLATLRKAVDALTASMFRAWDYLSPFDCLTYEEIKWELINLGKYNNVKDQARLAVDAMDKSPSDKCITLAEYQECAYNYMTVTDLTHDSKHFFGYLEGR